MSLLLPLIVIVFMALLVKLTAYLMRTITLTWAIAFAYASALVVCAVLSQHMSSTSIENFPIVLRASLSFTLQLALGIGLLARYARRSTDSAPAGLKLAAIACLLSLSMFSLLAILLAFSFFL